MALDPRYAWAWASLSGAYSLLATANPEKEVAYRDLQGKAALKAVELAPNLAVAQARLSQYFSHIGQQSKAEEHFRTAFALDPNDPLVLGYTSTRAVWNGDFKKAVELWRRIAQQDPLSPTVRTNLAVMLLMNGQLDEALAENRKALEIHPEAGAGIQAQIVRILILLGATTRPGRRHREFRPARKKIMQSPCSTTRLAAALEADAALTRLESEMKDFKNAVLVADVYVSRGMIDEAFALLEKTRNSLKRDKDQRTYLGWYFQEEIRVSPYLKQLHADPRWPGADRPPELTESLSD